MTSCLIRGSRSLEEWLVTFGDSPVHSVCSATLCPPCHDGETPQKTQGQASLPSCKLLPQIFWLPRCKSNQSCVHHPTQLTNLTRCLLPLSPFHTLLGFVSETLFFFLNTVSCSLSFLGQSARKPWGYFPQLVPQLPFLLCTTAGTSSSCWDP